MKEFFISKSCFTYFGIIFLSQFVVFHKWRHVILEKCWPPIVTRFITKALALRHNILDPLPPKTVTSFFWTTLTQKSEIDCCIHQGWDELLTCWPYWNLSVPFDLQSSILDKILTLGWIHYIKERIKDLSGPDLAHGPHFAHFWYVKYSWVSRPA